MNHKVFNWQLNREMDYVYPQSPPDKQAAWVFDTNKCIACQTCTMACKNAWTSGKGQEYMWWNNVETKPWGFYPMLSSKRRTTVRTSLASYRAKMIFGIRTSERTKSVSRSRRDST